jgi:hypothetical protein
MYVQSYLRLNKYLLYCSSINYNKLILISSMYPKRLLLAMQSRTGLLSMTEAPQTGPYLHRIYLVLVSLSPALVFT